MADLVFKGQREGEKVKFTFRRHFLTTRKGMLFLLVMTLIGVLPLFLWQDDPRMFWVFLIFVLIGLLGFGYSVMLWYFSIFIVTDQRIRQITQKGFFSKNVVDLGLDRIQSISYGIPGVLGGMFNFGTILVQTGVGDLVISMAADPEKVYNKLQNLVK